MAKIIKIKIEDKATETLAKERDLLVAEIASSNITWRNAKKQEKSVPYGVFSHTGKILVDKDEDSVIYGLGMDVIYKAESERRASDTVATCKATHAVKKETVSLTIKSVIGEKHAKVSAQLAKAQKLAQAVRSIDAEITRRTQAAALAEAIAKDAAKAADALAARSAAEYGTATKAA